MLYYLLRLKQIPIGMLITLIKFIEESVKRLQRVHSVLFENYLIHKRYDNKLFSIYKKGTAAFLATEFTINFFGTLNFTNNNGSALVLVSSVAIFGLNTNVVFHNNIGFNGGAIALVGFSVLTLSDNMSFILSNNQAKKCRGAIYSYSIDKHDYVSSRTCFFYVQ